MIKTKHFALLLVVGLLIQSCSMTRMAANQTTSILVQALPVFERETNLEFAKNAIAGNLKLLEGLLEVTPDNVELLLLTARSYTLYTFGFIEEKIEIADKQGDYETKQRYLAQAVDFYKRAYEFSVRALAQSRKSFPDVLHGDLDQLSGELKKCKKKLAPALFWTGYTWGNLINLQQTNPSQLVNLPKVELLMQRVLELDAEFYFGGSHLFFGVYYGSRPKMFGGDPEKAKGHFRQAIEMTEGKFLIAKFLFARFYAVPAQDRELFEKTLNEIIAADDNLYPEQSLANQLAKRNAKRWLTYADALFL